MIEALPQTRSALVRAHRTGARMAATLLGYRTAFVALASVLVAAFADILVPLPMPLRALFTLGLVAYCGVSAWRAPRAKRTSEVPLERAARLVEEKNPHLNNALINAVQFEAEMAAGPDSHSAALMRREMERAERVAGNVVPDSTVDTAPTRRARRRLLLIAGATIASLVFVPRAWRFEAPRLLLFWQDHPPFTLTDFAVMPGDTHVKLGGSVPITVKVSGLAPESLDLVVGDGARERVIPLMAGETGVFTQSLDELTDDTTYYLRGNTGRSRRYRILMDRAPEVRAIKATLTPPAYTGKPPSTAVVGDKGIAGLNGTVVDVEVEASRPVAGGRLAIVTANGSPAEATLTADPARPQVSRARFTINRDAGYRIDLSGADGLEKKSAAQGKITLLRDEKPLVYIAAPGQNAVVAPDMRIAIRTEAEDDVALRQIEVHRIVNNMADNAQVFPVAAQQPKADATLTLDLKDLGARPGDVIQYYATAYDNDPGKPNLTDSDRYWLWVVSREDYQKILSQQRDMPKMVEDYRALTDALRSLADRQRALADRAAALTERPNQAGSESKALQWEQAGLRADARELAEAMRTLAKQPPQFDAERGLQQKLSALARQVYLAESSSMKRGESARNPADLARQSREAARQLENASGQGQKTIERALQAMEKLAPLYEDIAHLQELSKRQADLAMQARQVASRARQDSFQQSRLKELAQRQAEAKELLDGIRQNLNEHAAQCEVDAPNAARQARQLARALDDTGVSAQMSGASTAFDKREAEAGASQAESARRGLERLFQQSRNAQGACKSGLDKQIGLCLGQGAGDSLNQLSRGLGTKPGAGGQGRGMAQGEGGMPAPRPGSRPGESGAPGGQARQAAAFTALQQQGGQSDKRENRRHLAAGEPPGTLGSQDVEHSDGPARPPGFAADSAPGRYPAEYRRLVKDYFKSVAGGSK